MEVTFRILAFLFQNLVLFLTGYVTIHAIHDSDNDIGFMIRICHNMFWERWGTALGNFKENCITVDSRT